LPAGIIVKGIGGFYYVAAENGVYECKARGIFRKDDITPLPGDRISLSIIDDAKKIGNIEEILPRESALVRPAVANVNQVVFVIAVKSPEPDFVLLDKLIVTAEAKGINIVICINKIDLGTREEYEKIAQAYFRTNYKLIFTSSKINVGYDVLKEVLHGRISVFAGQSGVGKSTILNRIMDEQIMETGDVSRKIDRGRHTTRHAELVKLDSGGYIVDTPGFSSFELSNIKCEELQLFYPEFGSYLGSCRFTGCSHISEPGCSVKEAMEKGDVDVGRYNRYVQLYNILKQNEANKWKK